MARSNARAPGRARPGTPARALAAALASLLAAGLAQAQSTGVGVGGGGAGGGNAGAGGSGVTGASAGASAGSTAGGGTGLGAAIAAGVQAAAPAGSSLVTGVRAGLTFSDNLLLAPSGSERSGFVAEVSPYALYTAATDRLRGSGYVTLRSFFRTEGDRVSLLRPELNGNFTAKLYDDWLWLDAIGRISTVAASPLGAVSFNQAASGVNTATVRSYQLSPYVRSRTPWFDYELRYRYASSNLSSSFFGQTQQSGIASATTGTRLGRWSLGYFGDITETQLGDGRTFGRRLSTGTLAYSVNPELRVGATASYEQIDNLRGTDGRDYGYGPGAFIDWRPNSRFSLYAQTSRRYYGTTNQASVNWRTRQSTWNLTYTRSVLSSADASLLFFDPAALGSRTPGTTAFNPVTSQLFQQSLLLFGLTPLDLTVLTNALVLDKRLVASGGLVGLRNSLVGNVFYNTRESVGSFTQNVAPTGPRGNFGGGLGIGAAFNGTLTQRGFTATYQHRLDAGSNVSLTAQRTVSQLDGSLLGLSTPGDTTLTQVVAGFTTRLTSDTTAGVGLRRAVQRRDGAGASYTENAVFATLDKRF